MSVEQSRDLTATKHFKLDGRYVIHTNSPFLRIMRESRKATIDLIEGMAGLSYSAIIEFDGYIIYDENSILEFLHLDSFKSFTFKIL